MQTFWAKIKSFLQTLSFRTGVIWMFVCIILYVLSFAILPIEMSVSLKTTLWAALFGMAKFAQYVSLIILGKEGIARLKRALKKPKK